MNLNYEQNIIDNLYASRADDRYGEDKISCRESSMEESKASSVYHPTQ